MQEAVPKKCRLAIIAGARDYERVVQHQGARTRVVPFTEQPWHEIDQADIIISRAGALAGYEILCSAKKVIFIPFPHAIDRHQYYNAEYFTKIGDALLYDEADITAGMLVQRMQHFLSLKERFGTKIVRDADKRIADCVVRDLDHEET
jgi:UDP-N-acetylglucosamine:LPS N-acetylglucosamine transferase